MMEYEREGWRIRFYYYEPTDTVIAVYKDFETDDLNSNCVKEVMSYDDYYTKYCAYFGVSDPFKFNEGIGTLTYFKSK